MSVEPLVVCCVRLGAHLATRGSPSMYNPRVDVYVAAASYPRWSLKPRMRRVIRSIATCMPASARHRASASLNDIERVAETRTKPDKMMMSQGDWRPLLASVTIAAVVVLCGLIAASRDLQLSDRTARRTRSCVSAAYTRRRDLFSTSPLPQPRFSPAKRTTTATPPSKMRLSRQRHHC